MAETRMFGNGRLRLAREAPTGLIAVRVRAGDSEARRTLATTLGLDLPPSPSAPTVAAAIRLFWTAPDALLLDGVGATEAERLGRALSRHHIAIHDVTDARTRFTIAESDAPALLGKATSLDLDASTFPVGAAALTRVAGLTGLLFLRDQSPSYELLTDRPVEDWLWAWLVDAAGEFA